jgi:MATE family, multidrug efflux pump
MTGIMNSDARTRLLLEGAVARTLVRLAAPNVAVMFVQASIGLIETYFVARLGTDALAGVGLVFPVPMLMQMMSAGAIGGGISSPRARSEPPRRCECAGDACARHRAGPGPVLHRRSSRRRPLDLCRDGRTWGSA